MPARPCGSRPTLPGDLGSLLEDARQLSRRIAPFRPVLCHNDLLPANLIDDGRRLWLVDWEYAGAGHPLFDLANASANAAFSDDQDRSLLEAYRGHVDPRDLSELRIFKAVSLLRESLWSTIQIGRLRHRLRLPPVRRRKPPSLSRSTEPAGIPDRSMDHWPVGHVSGAEVRE